MASGNKNGPETNSLDERLRHLEERYDELDKRYKDLQSDKKPRDADERSKAGSEAGNDSNENPTSRFRIILSRYDRQSGERKDYAPDESDNTLQAEKSSKYAWQLRNFADIDPDDDMQSEIEISGKELRNLLKTVLRHYPHHWFIGDAVTLVAPYEPLVHNWDLLCKEVDKDGGSEEEQIGRRDLKDMMEVINKQGSGDVKLDEYFKNRESLKENRSTTFQNLWTIFPPGMLVYSRQFMKQDQIFIVMENEMTWPRLSPRSRTFSDWGLVCFTYDWTGEKFVRRVVTLRIEHFEGTKPIATLSVQPFKDMKDEAEIRKGLVTRGRLFKNYCTLPDDKRMFDFSGKAIYEKSGIRGVVSDAVIYDSDDDDITLRRRAYDRRSKTREATYSTTKGVVMIDFASYYKYCSSTSSIGNIFVDDEDRECDCSQCRENDALQNDYRTQYDDKTGDELEDWDDLQYMLCPPRVLGYVLREKKWAQLHVDGIKPIPTEGNTDAFYHKLKLAGPKDGLPTKKLLMGLVKNHGISENSGSSWNSGYQLDDIVADKGKGLVILLYGPPGVGKTSTAQTIAIAAGKPLFAVGVADVGTNARLVESNLENIFDLATTWKAVLLIDEADVFLQSRARGELGATVERNALVSVFLRVLEYYQGILILTTNQIAQFDVAVQSRIHIAIRYEKLKEEQTWAIFKSFIKQYDEKKLVDYKDMPQIERWAKNELPRKNFDGRQIRNIMTSAMGIARAESRLMNHDDLLSVVNIVETFKTDLAYQMMSYESSQKGRLD